jgi:hypothetical protein
VIKSRRLRLAGHVAHDTENAYKMIIGKPEGDRPIGRPRQRQKDNIRMDLRETDVRRCRLDSFGSGQGPVAN